MSAVNDTFSRKRCNPIFRLLNQHQPCPRRAFVQFSGLIQYSSSTNNSDTDFCTCSLFYASAAGLLINSIPVSWLLCQLFYTCLYSKKGIMGKCLPEFILQELATLTFINNNLQKFNEFRQLNSDLLRKIQNCLKICIIWIIQIIHFLKCYTIN